MQMKLKERYRALCAHIKRLNSSYYDDDAPLVSDQDYDQLMQELKAFEQSYPELLSPDSPTQKVGGSVRRNMAKVVHEVPMLSLQDYFSEAEIHSFVEKTMLSIDPLAQRLAFVVEEKIDGLSLSMEYREGQFVRASTRGDGQVGEDVTANVRQFANLPFQLKDRTLAYLEIRAEVYMPRAVFVELNAGLEEQGAKLFANPRNAAAGSLRQLDPMITKQRKLSYFCFNIQQIQGKNFSAHHEGLRFLAEQGFSIVPHQLCFTAEEVMTAIHAIEARRAELPYGIDGAVVKLDDLFLRGQLGESSKVPRWAAAYKYAAEQQKTKLLAIEIQVGRTGKLTPLALLEPVRVAGSTISKATLHNEDYIKEKDIRVGDIVYVQKAGDVIPAITGVDFQKRAEDLRIFSMPSHCPACQAEVERAEGEAATYCTGANCPAQRMRHLEHFTGRDTMDIEGLGERNLLTFANLGWLSDVADIFLLSEHREEMLQLPGYKETSVDKLLAAIERAKTRSLDRLLAALGILHVGKVAARNLALHFDSIESLIQATEAELLSIPDFGAVMAASLRRYFTQEQNLELLKKLHAAGVRPQRLKNASTQEGVLAVEGKTFVLTGTLLGLERQKAAELIQAAGGKVSSSVSKKTDYVIVGENPGSKALKARELALTILDESAFLDLLGYGERV